MSNTFPSPASYAYGQYTLSPISMARNPERLPSHGPSMNTTNHQTNIQTHPLPRRPSPPSFHGSNAPSAVPTAGFVPYQPEDHPQPSTEATSAIMVSGASAYSHGNTNFNMYIPRQNPESNNHRGLQKHATPAASPDGAPSPAGRRRTRTKVVAWDPRDLEDIYYRKEVAKEDWDTICKVWHPTSSMLACLSDLRLGLSNPHQSCHEAASDCTMAPALQSRSRS